MRTPGGNVLGARPYFAELEGDGCNCGCCMGDRERESNFVCP